jgi:hypothetical protein
MIELPIFYDLYDEYTFVERIYDKNIALYLLLHNFIKSNYSGNYHFNIVKYISHKYISFEQIKIIDNRIVKINKYNNHITIYSPYDLELFEKTELSLLYQQFYDNKLNLYPISQTQPLQTQPLQTQPLQTQPLQTQPLQTQPLQTQSLQTQPLQTQSLQTQPLQTQPLQTQPLQTQSLQTPQELSKTEKKSKDKNSQDFTKDELEDMKNLLDKLKDEKKDYDKICKDKEENFMELDANKRYDEKKDRKEKEKEKEKYNIFKYDIKIFNKLTHEENFSENFVPALFEAKYYIIKYLKNNDYFVDEDVENPSEELYELYKTIYDYANEKIDTKSDIYDTFVDVFQEFNESLPKNKQILTDRQIMNTFNEKSEKTEIFKGDAVVDILLANSDIDTDDEENTNA